jgi:hypothetical protein
MFASSRAALLGRTILCAAMFTAALFSSTVNADNEPPTLDLNPASIDGRIVSSTEPIYVQVRLKAGAQDLTDIVLSSFSNDGVTATVEGAASSANLAQLPATAEHVWTLKLVPSKSDALPPAALNVNVGVTFKEGKEPPRQRYLFQTIKITAPTATTPPTLSFDINPATIDGRVVSSAEPIYVQVRLKAGAQDLTDIALSSFSNDGITATIDGVPSSANLSQLPATADHA